MEEEEARVSPLTQTIVRDRVASSRETEVDFLSEVEEVPDCQDKTRHAVTVVDHSHTPTDFQLGKQCRACSKVGHHSRICRSKQKPVKINNVSNACGKSADSSSEESVFHVTHCSKISAVHATLFGKETSFLVDSGATVNIVHTSTCPTNLKLKQPCPRIMAYGSDKPLPVDGYFSTDLEYKGKRTRAKFYVINSDKKTENLPCADTAHALGLIQFAFSASLNTDPSAQSMSSIADNFTELFDGKVGHIKAQKSNCMWILRYSLLLNSTDAFHFIFKNRWRPN